MYRGVEFKLAIFAFIVLRLNVCDAQFLFQNDHEVQINDSCKIRGRNQIGVCKPIDNCPSIIRELSGGGEPTLCMFEGISPMVCCPILNNRTINRNNITPLRNVLKPYYEYKDNHNCAIGDGTIGTVMYEQYCPAMKELRARGQRLKRLCDYEVCRDLVCCPVIRRPRLRQDCSYEHPFITERLYQNFECKIPSTREDGLVTPYEQCPFYDELIMSGTTLPRVCDWRFCNESVCCPIKALHNSGCRYYDDSLYKLVEVVAGTCRMDGTGARGVCRPLFQCPSQYEPNMKLTICGRDCKADFICCPEPDIRLLSPGAASCARSRQYVYEDRKIIKKFLPADVDNTRIDTEVSPSGGVIAEPKEFPHMATLGYLSNERNSVVQWLCGGSLISDRFVLTAGHCLRSEIGLVKYVRLGIQDLVIVEKISRNTDCPEQFRVTQRIPHPNYRPDEVYNDIALLKLDRKVIFNADIRPVCLPENLRIPHELIAIGFGDTGYKEDRTEQLIKVYISLFTHAECNATYRDSNLRRGIVDETQFCLGARSGIQDTCPGDSGGPIGGAHPDYYKMHTIFGVTSFGRPCGFANSPGVYTRVFAFRDWIEKVVWQ